jgi:hydroxyacylglutathione hydrolase
VPLEIEAIPVGPFQANAYLVTDSDTQRCVLVDPGSEGERLAALMIARTLVPEAIWVTHGHLDHVGGIAGVRRAFSDVPIWMHSADLPLYDNVANQGRLYGLSIEPAPPVTNFWNEGDELSLASHVFRVVHLPGHAPGHVALVGDEDALVGDVVFAGSIGRTDLPLSDPKAMQASLARVATWPLHLRLHPGHGESTTIAAELRSNPFLAGMARPVGAR